jgi:hypothetical protein
LREGAGNLAVRNLGRLAVLAVLALTGLAGASRPVVDASRWMTEEAMRSAFIGSTLDGHYVDGLRWSEMYSADGRLDYRESLRRGPGYWYFRAHVFCTFYDPGYGLSGGCWTAIKTSANCYEFYIAGTGNSQGEEDAVPGPTGSWAARAWRRGEPSTCEDRPTA